MNPGANELRTVYDYYTNTNDFGYGEVKQVSGNGGRWTYYVYDAGGRISKELRAFKNQTFTTDTNLCRVKIFDYAGLSGSGDIGANTNTPRPGEF